MDFGEGKHKSHCLALGKLWQEKERIESCLWHGTVDVTCSDDGGKSTNPFDDDYLDPEEHKRKRQHEYAVVGNFWHDQPQSPLQKQTHTYCVVLLQLVQLLGRAESWRVSRIVTGQRGTFDRSSCWRTKALNPLSIELALDLAFQLFHLDRTDRRVRLLIPSLLLEGGYYQEAYNFIKYWTKADGCLMILDLALPGGAEDDNQAWDSFDDKDHDMLESPTVWMDSEIVYPSIGMVFELAYFKCHMLVLLKIKQEISVKSDIQCHQLLDHLADADVKELENQVDLLLSVVHKWNPHLLPKLGKESYDVCFGASSSSSSHSTNKNDPRTPPALDSLLNLHPPGFELQYSFGNPGGGSIDEASSIWQRDMVLWHVMNPLTMEYLSKFCKNLEVSLVDTSLLTGEVSDSVYDIATSNRQEEQRNAAAQRKEAEELVARLQNENPDRTMDQIMMHPDMAALMIKHLHTE
jgi:hypothetical protein